MENYEHVDELHQNLKRMRDRRTHEVLCCSNAGKLSEAQAASVCKRYEAFYSAKSERLIAVHELVRHDGDVLLFFEDISTLTPISSLLLNYRENNQFYEEAQLCCILKQILVYLQRLHDFGVTHQNLNPESIYLDAKSNVKLGVFDMFEKKAQSIYNSPEMLLLKQYNAKSDVFAVGCLLFELTALKTPFMLTAKTDSLAFASLPELPTFYSKEYCRLLRRMLQRDNKLRPSVSALLSSAIMAKTEINEISYCVGTLYYLGPVSSRIQLIDASDLSLDELYCYLIANDDEIEFRTANVLHQLEQHLGRDALARYQAEIYSYMTGENANELKLDAEDVVQDILVALEAIRRGLY